MNNKTNSDGLWQEQTFHCRYCGELLKKETKYCSEQCKKKDSVWQFVDD